MKLFLVWSIFVIFNLGMKLRCIFGSGHFFIPLFKHCSRSITHVHVCAMLEVFPSYFIKGVTFLVMGSAEALPEAPTRKTLFVEDMTDEQLASAVCVHLIVLAEQK